MLIFYNEDIAPIETQKIFIQAIKSSSGVMKFSFIKNLCRVNGDKLPEYATKLLRNPFWLSNKSLIRTQ